MLFYVLVGWRRGTNFCSREKSSMKHGVEKKRPHLPPSTDLETLTFRGGTQRQRLNLIFFTMLYQNIISFINLYVAGSIFCYSAMHFFRYWNFESPRYVIDTCKKVLSQSRLKFIINIFENFTEGSNMQLIRQIFIFSCSVYNFLLWAE